MPETKKQSLSDASGKQLKDFLNLCRLGKINWIKETVFFESLNHYGANQPLQQNPGLVASHTFADCPASKPLRPRTDRRKPITEAPNEELQKTAALLEKELQDAKAKEATKVKSTRRIS